MPNIGLALYQDSNAPEHVQRASHLIGNLFLCHQCPKVATSLRQANPAAFIGLRPDVGKDEEQLDLSRAPELEAARWAELIRQQVDEVAYNVFDYTLGVNEAFPGDDEPEEMDWRAAFEYALCQRVQYGKGMPQDWRPLGYAWGGIPVGHIDGTNVGRFAKVFESAWATSAHLYLDEMVGKLEDDKGPWFLWRPLKVWLPELTKLGIGLRLLATEIGTYFPPNQYGYDKKQAADLDLRIYWALAREAERLRFVERAPLEFVGAFPFGLYTTGKMEIWDISEGVGLFEAEALSEKRMFLSLLTGPPGPGEPSVQDIVVDPAFKPTIKICPNYTANRPTTRGCIIHATRSGLDIGLESEYTLTVSYMLTPGSNSSHFVVGPSQVARLVHDQDASWHALENNFTHLGLEVAQPKPATPFTDFQYQATADIVKKWAKAYGIPLTRVFSQAQLGIIGHEDTEQGKRDGKSDPGPQWDWDKFMGLLTGQPQAEWPVGEGMRNYLKAHPEYGVPRMASWYSPDGMSEMVWTTPTKEHRYGGMCIARKYLGWACTMAWWD